MSLAFLIISLFVFPKDKPVFSATASIEILPMSNSMMYYNDFMNPQGGDDIATQSKILTSQRIIFLTAQKNKLIDPEINFDDFHLHPEIFDLVSGFQSKVLKFRS